METESFMIMGRIIGTYSGWDWECSVFPKGCLDKREEI
jgi:hypothetical protein